MASMTAPIGGVAASVLRPGARVPNVLEREKATPVMEVAFVMEVSVLELPEIGGVTVEGLTIDLTVPELFEKPIILLLIDEGALALGLRLGCGLGLLVGVHTRKAPTSCEVRGWGGVGRLTRPPPHPLGGRR